MYQGPTEEGISKKRKIISSDSNAAESYSMMKTDITTGFGNMEQLMTLVRVVLVWW